MTDRFEDYAAQILDGVSQAGAMPDRIAIDPANVEQDLAKLILGLMEFLRQIMELQAIRRLENGGLTHTQEEALGTTLMRAETAIKDMAARFDLTPEDLSLDLGPLGRTI